jgi:hypothetical protein
MVISKKKIVPAKRVIVISVKGTAIAKRFIAISLKEKGTYND